MKKQKKANQVPSIPEIYRNVTRDASRQHHTVCEDVHGQFFRHNSPAEILVLKDKQHKVWANFDKFTAENEQTILAYHDNLFSNPPPADQDKVTTAMYVWFALCDKAADRTTKTPVTAEGRKSSILTSKYSLTDVDGLNVLKTPQARVCYKILVESIKARAAADTKGLPREAIAAYVEEITEEDLRKAVINRAGEIRTRQDPWRIFQYYRPEMMKLGLIRRV